MPSAYFRIAGIPKSSKTVLARAQSASATLVNEIKTDYNATLAKLDLDGGVADTNYAALNSVGSASVVPVGVREDAAESESPTAEAKAPEPPTLPRQPAPGSRK